MKTLAVFVILAISLSNASNCGCPEKLPKTDNVRRLFNFCYQFILTENKNWSYAYENCKTNGGFLIDIYSQTVQDFIVDGWKELRHQAPYETGVWIGLSRGAGNYSDKWFKAKDNEEMKSYWNWDHFQPGNNANENCVLMEYSGMSGDGKWHDYDCGNTFGWICGYPI